ncbi:hypothetical protein CEUSTIGMA_g9059.t1 [Chlamydomonas eustigma]|uniref:Uncharacterized protein n=1 Tax=Chlamydomonas eustigma TaxID=1157962 RepID=A0A250XEZ5_9CHLO|nr:hypothetical protein CEUSTIGMA_g9059.t1 [Chlamydomonas eustigma]|eukprot:GAX81631.1 hypothetical protein CEUSTIGMA_g9059.t1 [Chlamydomonas eustigma]
MNSSEEPAVFHAPATNASDNCTSSFVATSSAVEAAGHRVFLDQQAMSITTTIPDTNLTVAVSSANNKPAPQQGVKQNKLFSGVTKKLQTLIFGRVGNNSRNKSPAAGTVQTPSGSFDCTTGTPDQDASYQKETAGISGSSKRHHHAESALAAYLRAFPHHDVYGVAERWHLQTVMNAPQQQDTTTALQATSSTSKQDANCSAPGDCGSLHTAAHNQQPAMIVAKTIVLEPPVAAGPLARGKLRFRYFRKSMLGAAGGLPGTDNFDELSLPHGGGQLLLDAASSAADTPLPMPSPTHATAAAAGDEVCLSLVRDHEASSGGCIDEGGPISLRDHKASSAGGCIDEGGPFSLRDHEASSGGCIDEGGPKATATTSVNIVSASLMMSDTSYSGAATTAAPLASLSLVAAVSSDGTPQAAGTTNFERLPSPSSLLPQSPSDSCTCSSTTRQQCSQPPSMMKQMGDTPNSYTCSKQPLSLLKNPQHLLAGSPPGNALRKAPDVIAPSSAAAAAASAPGGMALPAVPASVLTTLLPRRNTRDQQSHSYADIIMRSSSSSRGHRYLPPKDGAVVAAGDASVKIEEAGDDRATAQLQLQLQSHGQNALLQHHAAPSASTQQSAASAAAPLIMSVAPAPAAFPITCQQQQRMGRYLSSSRVMDHSVWKQMLAAGKMPPASAASAGGASGVEADGAAGSGDISDRSCLRTGFAVAALAAAEACTASAPAAAAVTAGTAEWPQGMTDDQWQQPQPSTAISMDKVVKEEPGKQSTARHHSNGSEAGSSAHTSHHHKQRQSCAADAAAVMTTRVSWVRFDDGLLRMSAGHRPPADSSRVSHSISRLADEQQQQVAVEVVEDTTAVGHYEIPLSSSSASSPPLTISSSAASAAATGYPSLSHWVSESSSVANDCLLVPLAISTTSTALTGSSSAATAAQQQLRYDYGAASAAPVPYTPYCNPCSPHLNKRMLQPAAAAAAGQLEGAAAGGAALLHDGLITLTLSDLVRLVQQLTTVAPPSHGSSSSPLASLSAAAAPYPGLPSWTLQQQQQYEASAAATGSMASSPAATLVATAVDGFASESPDYEVAAGLAAAAPAAAAAATTQQHCCDFNPSSSRQQGAVHQPSSSSTASRFQTTSGCNAVSEPGCYDDHRSFSSAATPSRPVVTGMPHPQVVHVPPRRMRALKAAAGLTRADSNPQPELLDQGALGPHDDHCLLPTSTIRHISEGGQPLTPKQLETLGIILQPLKSQQQGNDTSTAADDISIMACVVPQHIRSHNPYYSGRTNLLPFVRVETGSSIPPASSPGDATAAATNKMTCHDGLPPLMASLSPVKITNSSCPDTVSSAPFFSVRTPLPVAGSPYSSPSPPPLNSGAAALLLSPAAVCTATPSPLVLPSAVPSISCRVTEQLLKAVAGAALVTGTSSLSLSTAAGGTDKIIALTAGVPNLHHAFQPSGGTCWHDLSRDGSFEDSCDYYGDDLAGHDQPEDSHDHSKIDGGAVVPVEAADDCCHGSRHKRRGLSFGRIHCMEYNAVFVDDEERLMHTEVVDNVEDNEDECNRPDNIVMPSKEMMSAAEIQGHSNQAQQGSLQLLQQQQHPPSATSATAAAAAAVPGSALRGSLAWPASVLPDESTCRDSLLLAVSATKTATSFPTAVANKLNSSGPPTIIVPPPPKAYQKRKESLLLKRPPPLPSLSGSLLPVSITGMPFKAAAGGSPVLIQQAAAAGLLITAAPAGLLTAAPAYQAEYYAASGVFRKQASDNTETTQAELDFSLWGDDTDVDFGMPLPPFATAAEAASTTSTDAHCSSSLPQAETHTTDSATGSITGSTAGTYYHLVLGSGSTAPIVAGYLGRSAEDDALCDDSTSYRNGSNEQVSYPEDPAEEHQQLWCLEQRGGRQQVAPAMCAAMAAHEQEALQSSKGTSITPPTVVAVPADQQEAPQSSRRTCITPPTATHHYAESKLSVTAAVRLTTSHEASSLTTVLCRGGAASSTPAVSAGAAEVVGLSVPFKEGEVVEAVGDEQQQAAIQEVVEAVGDEQQQAAIQEVVPEAVGDEEQQAAIQEVVPEAVGDEEQQAAIQEVVPEAVGDEEQQAAIQSIMPECEALLLVVACDAKYDGELGCVMRSVEAALLEPDSNRPQLLPADELLLDESFETAAVVDPAAICSGSRAATIMTAASAGVLLGQQQQYYLPAEQAADIISHHRQLTCEHACSGRGVEHHHYPPLCSLLSPQQAAASSPSSSSPDESSCTALYSTTASADDEVNTAGCTSADDDDRSSSSSYCSSSIKSSSLSSCSSDMRSSSDSADSLLNDDSEVISATRTGSVIRVPLRQQYDWSSTADYWCGHTGGTSGLTPIIVEAVVEHEWHSIMDLHSAPPSPVFNTSRTSAAAAGVAVHGMTRPISFQATSRAQAWIPACLAIPEDEDVLVEGYSSDDGDTVFEEEGLQLEGYSSSDDTVIEEEEEVASASGISSAGAQQDELEKANAVFSTGSGQAVEEEVITIVVCTAETESEDEEEDARNNSAASNEAIADQKKDGVLAYDDDVDMSEQVLVASAASEVEEAAPLATTAASEVEEAAPLATTAASEVEEAAPLATAAASEVEEAAPLAPHATDGREIVVFASTASGEEDAVLASASDDEEEAVHDTSASDDEEEAVHDTSASDDEEEAVHDTSASGDEEEGVHDASASDFAAPSTSAVDDEEEEEAVVHEEVPDAMHEEETAVHEEVPDAVHDEAVHDAVHEEEAVVHEEVPDAMHEVVVPDAVHSNEEEAVLHEEETVHEDVQATHEEEAVHEEEFVHEDVPVVPAMHEEEAVYEEVQAGHASNYLEERVFAPHNYNSALGLERPAVCSSSSSSASDQGSDSRLAERTTSTSASDYDGKMESPEKVLHHHWAADGVANALDIFTSQDEQVQPVACIATTKCSSTSTTSSTASSTSSSETFQGLIKRRPSSPELPVFAVRPSSPELPVFAVRPSSPELPVLAVRPSSPELPVFAVRPSSPELPVFAVRPSSPKRPVFAVRPSSPELPVFAVRPGSLCVTEVAEGFSIK